MRRSGTYTRNVMFIVMTASQVSSTRLEVQHYLGPSETGEDPEDRGKACGLCGDSEGL